jgi:hypothetical protein
MRITTKQIVAKLVGLGRPELVGGKSLIDYVTDRGAVYIWTSVWSALLGIESEAYCFLSDDRNPVLVPNPNKAEFCKTNGVCPEKITGLHNRTRKIVWNLAFNK